ncbi:hypothetical protein [Vibrio cincinnatiensis]|uniref:hypothetical protein n=1 Tax=Vibrio cincinnatiensis TaxID=675 RepID=UPI0013021909|nr:hypothetical protein [Vibrio cincinnatiensis]
MRRWIVRLLIVTAILPSLGIATELTLLQEQARLGDAESQYQLAQHYQFASTDTTTDQDRLYWLTQAAEQGHISAMEQLSYYYLAKTENPEHLENALRWLIKLTSLGQTQAAITIGDMYQQGRPFPETFTMAELWYYSVADREPDAEQRYAFLLQKKFDQQRAKQISNMTALEKASVYPPSPVLPVADVNPPSPRELDSPNLLIVVLLLIIAVGASSYLFLKRYPRLPQSPHLSQVDQLHEQARIIQQQKRQLEKLYRELTRRQQQQNHQQHEQQWIVACALFGFSPDQLPNEQAIKARYKQLSKIYHPDAQGSDEEMKHLNHSLNLILQKRNK